MRKLHIALFVALAPMFCLGCTSTSNQLNATLHQGVEAKLVGDIIAAAEQNGGVTTVLLAGDLPSAIKSAAAAHRPTKKAESTELAGLPKGHLQLQSVSITASHASLTGRLGPVPKPRPGVALLACGTGLTVNYEKVAGEWQRGNLETMDC